MIFLRDIAHPFDSAPAWVGQPFPWAAQPLVVNLEGPVVPVSANLQSQPVVYNHPSILNGLVAAGVAAAGLANNHIADVDSGIDATRLALRGVGISSFGAGLDAGEARSPAVLEDRGVKYILLGFGWVTVQCRPAGLASSGVNPFTPEGVLSSIAYWRRTEPDAAIVVIPHWNYELEAYPQPAHRQLAFSAIDAGAAAVIGHHSHRVAGMEIHKGHPVVYSLGNWWMPQGVYFNGRLSFPDETLEEVAFEWSAGEPAVLHWFEYRRRSHELLHSGTEELAESDRIKSRTPYAGMSHDEYVVWFREHRVKRKALPVYADYRHAARNKTKDAYVRARHAGVQAVDRLGLRGK